jgi:hypothetical protein
LTKPEKYDPKNSEINPDLPGLGQYYCLPCARYFTTQAAKDQHLMGKVHKKRMKVLKEDPYTQTEAEAAAGLFTDNGKLGVKKLAESALKKFEEAQMETDKLLVTGHEVQETHVPIFASLPGL